MAWRFRKRIRIAPGLHVNAGKRGASLSVGPPGASVNISKDGVRGTAGLPGTGLSATTRLTKKRKSTDKTDAPRPAGTLRPVLWIGVVIAFGLWLLL